jgi:DNA-binding transcriptional LysR family regulator
MDLRRLRTFVAVAEHGTVSKAAQVLRITQPALSRQIGALEDELGFQLFRRAGRRLRLTASGEQLVSDSRSLLSHADTLNERAQALRRGDLDAITVVGSPLTIGTLFPTFFHRHAEHAPGVQLNVIEAEASRHFEMLERGEASFSINVINDLEVDGHRFGCQVLPRFHVMAACAPDFPVEQSETIDIRRLVQHPLLALNRTYSTRNVFDAACRLAGLHVDMRIESAAVHALMDFAEAGHGIAILPSILRTGSRSLQVMRVTHRGEPLHISLAVLWDKRRTLPRHAKAFATLLSEHVRQTFPPLRFQKTNARAGRRANGHSRRR